MKKEKRRLETAQLSMLFRIDRQEIRGDWVTDFVDFSPLSHEENKMSAAVSAVEQKTCARFLFAVCAFHVLFLL
jgi:hypothetical protein